jgi:hypothetical protein
LHFGLEIALCIGVLLPKRHRSNPSTSVNYLSGFACDHLEIRRKMALADLEKPNTQKLDDYGMFSGKKFYLQIKDLESFSMLFAHCFQSRKCTAGLRDGL